MTVLAQLAESSAGQKLALVCAVWPLLFIPINFALYYSYDSDNYFRDNGVHQIPTISLAGSRLPSSALLTYGLHFEGFALALLFVCIYKETVQRVLRFHAETPFEEPTDAAGQTAFGRVVELLTFRGCPWCCCFFTKVTARSLAYWNKVAAAFGIFAAFCMSMVGSIQLVANETAHGTFAFFMFASGVLHVLTYYYGVAKYCSPHPHAQLLRQMCIFLAIPFNIVILFIAAVVYGSCDEFSCRAFAVDILPVLEFTTVVALLLYMGAFYWDLKSVSLVVAANAVSPDVANASSAV